MSFEQVLIVNTTSTGSALPVRNMGFFHVRAQFIFLQVIIYTGIANLFYFILSIISFEYLNFITKYI